METSSEVAASCKLSQTHIWKEFHLFTDFSFDKVADVLYIKFSEENIAESDQISSGIIVDYSKRLWVLKF